MLIRFQQKSKNVTYCKYFNFVRVLLRALYSHIILKFDTEMHEYLMWRNIYVGFIRGIYSERGFKYRQAIILNENINFQVNYWPHFMANRNYWSYIRKPHGHDLIDIISIKEITTSDILFRLKFDTCIKHDVLSITGAPGPFLLDF